MFLRTWQELCCHLFTSSSVPPAGGPVVGYCRREKKGLKFKSLPMKRKLEKCRTAHDGTIRPIHSAESAGAGRRMREQSSAISFLPLPRIFIKFRRNIKA